MSNDLTGEQMQAKITAARREAEGLKDRIKRKKDDLADTSCKSIDHLGVIVHDLQSPLDAWLIARAVQCDKLPSTTPNPSRA
jgi:hypothetical protein